jgi:hypothetical protein
MKRSLWILALFAGTALASGSAVAQSPVSTGRSPQVRIVNGEPYRILRSETLVLYAHERRVPGGKWSATVVDRFFSTTPTSLVQPLTLETLKNAYPDNHKFHDLLTLAFRSDGELTRYDDHHNEYLVTRLLRQSLSGGTLLGAVH